MSSSTPPQKKPPITCHVLDTTTGRPARAIPVTLTLLSPLGPSAPLTAVTNADGRVTAWSGDEGPDAAERTLEELFREQAEREMGAGAEEAEMVWALRLDVKAFWRGRGVRAFFEEVEVRFVVRGGDVKGGERFHVPVLLGPFSYSTYRGS
ncbi:Hydroxyisourate hydrolase [Saccharata proteae CBS 121410]|uniref:5-hydroxyisourate hydrolase n=1 Tax=Saccharata proteae CBS 121410 TaxID=1314787 RepID=A0A6A5YBK4_9PEZI|nr:Hydroxyisourate hydrolase [Saccharata proteae CBS 121410]